MKYTTALLLCLALFSCGDDDGMAADAGGGRDAPTVDTGSTGGPTVTMGVYRLVGETYEDTGRTLVIEVGESCFTWSRVSPGHDDMGGLPPIAEPHDHFNAADNSSYVDGVVTWTEYGPAHDAPGAQADCARGTDGTTKMVNADEYFFDHNDVYLRIVSVD